MFAGIFGNGVTGVARPDWRQLKRLCQPGLETQELSRVPSRRNGRWAFRKGCPSTIYQHVE
jgi:hypothetical protein